MSGEGVESRVEEGLELVDPAHHLFQRLRLKLIDPLPAFASLGDEIGVLEHLEVLRDRSERNPKGLSQLPRRLFSAFEQHENGSPRRMCDRVKHVVLLQGSHASLRPSWILGEKLVESSRPVGQWFLVELSFEPVQERMSSRQKTRSGLLRDSPVGDGQEGRLSSRGQLET